MAKIASLPLTAAQLSALQCAGLLEPDELHSAGQEILRLSVQGDRLVVSRSTHDSVYRAITDAANVADEDRIRFGKGQPAAFLAGRASRSLTALATRVLHMRFEDRWSYGEDTGEPDQPRCPECGRVLDIDPACVISVPQADGSRTLKTAPAAPCSGCEFCIEIGGM